MDYLTSYNDRVNSALSPLDNKNVTAVLSLAFLAFGALVAPKLPDYALKWFEFVPFKIAVMSLIVWTANHDPGLAIMIATGLYVVMNKLANKRAFEPFINVKQPSYTNGNTR